MRAADLIGQLGNYHSADRNTTMLLRKLTTLGLLGLIIVVVAAELTYRVYLFGVDGLSYARVNSFHEIGLSGLIRPSEYPEVIYELKPGLDTWFKMARLRTNSAGLPDREYSLAKPANTFRIVLVGSSYSMPTGVAMEDSWQEVLERMLNAHARQKHYEVINFSVGGYDLRQLLATLKERAAAYAPDLVLVDLTLGSPIRFRLDEAYHRPFVPRAQTYPFFHSFALERLFPPAPPPDPPWVLPADQWPAAFVHVLAGFKSFAERSHLPLCFVILQHDPGQQAAATKLREQVSPYSSCIIDTSPAFTNENFSDLIIFTTDWHPNARAQRIFAHAVFDHLVAQELVEVAP